MSCYDCNYARQVGDRSRQDVVGCPIISSSREKMNNSTGQLLEGWYFANRHPGDTRESETPTEGLLHRGVIIARDGHCEDFSQR